ncbi:MAG: enoyl-CoA hydratase/isomerase family protein [Bacteroidota bacterium]
MKNEFQHWQLEIKDHIAFLTLDRPIEKNRLDQITLSELGTISQLLADDPKVWVIILQANGGCFSAGVDVSLIGSLVGQKSEIYRENLRKYQEFIDAFEAIRKPTIAALNGPVIGGGMILAVCCDFRIAAQNVFFELPEVKRSIGVIMGTQRIIRTIGIPHTKEMVMLGTKVHAERAFQIGLVNKVVPNDQLRSQAIEFANLFLELPPLAVGVCKQIINEAQFLERAGQDLEIEAQERLLMTHDFQEAISSFFEKRKPVYKGE